jgi:hypothetical protein
MTLIHSLSTSYRRTFARGTTQPGGCTKKITRNPLFSAVYEVYEFVRFVHFRTPRTLYEVYAPPYRGPTFVHGRTRRAGNSRNCEGAGNG